VPLLGVHADHLYAGVLGLEESPVAGDRSAGAETGDEVGDLGLRLAPDLGPGRANMSLEVRLVLVLIGHVKLGLGTQLHGTRDGPLRGPRERSQIVVQLLDVSSEHAQHDPFLGRNLVGERRR